MNSQGIMAEATRRAKWEYYTNKLIILLDASVRAQSLDFKLVWIRHALAIMDIRDQYEKKEAL